MEPFRVLVVDDEETIRHILINVLEENGCEIREAGTAEDGLRIVPDFKPAVALLDIVLPGMNGLDLLEKIKKISPDTEVVMMTSHASAETALRAIKQGAYTYLQKPFEDLDEIWTTVQRAIEQRELAQKKNTLLRNKEARSKELSSDVSLVETVAPDGDFGSYAEILEFFIDLATKELDVDRASLMLIDERTGDLRVAASRGLDTVDPASVTIKVGEGIAGGVAQTGEPFLLPAGRASRKAIRTGPNGGSGAAGVMPIALSVAIRTDQRILGAFNVTSRRTGKAFNEGDVAHLTALCNQLASAIEGSQRADRLQKAYESLKTTQEQLVRTERIKAIGQMAAGVAHDFNNALSVILARAEFIHRSFQHGTIEKAKLASDIETIIKTALQGAESIKRIQDYTRIRKDEPRAAVDLNAAVKDAVEITRPKWKPEAEARGQQVEIQIDLNDVPQVNGNVYELTQVIENLIFNAVEAMPGGGRIAIRTSVRDDVVVLEVSDTGKGMDEETQRRLFEPFFTTKDSGQGLGTSIIYGIIARHKGTITVRSEPGRGTTFTISLPPFVHCESTAPAPAEVEPGEDRRARVLLVDDEDPVRSVYEEILQISGHDVVAASGGEEALARFQKGRFDLLITDLSMDGMSGFELVERVKQVDPEVPVILLSGWAIEQEEDRVRSAGIDSVLIKPCRIDAVRRAVQQALRKPAGR